MDRKMAEGQTDPNLKDHQSYVITELLVVKHFPLQN